MEPSSIDVTLLLKRYGNGDADALAELIPQVYDEPMNSTGWLRAICMASE